MWVTRSNHAPVLLFISLVAFYKCILGANVIDFEIFKTGCNHFLESCHPWKYCKVSHTTLSCKILDLMVQSVSCLQCFSTMCQYHLDLWPWKTTVIIHSSWWSIASCKILEITLHSVSCLHHFPTMWQEDLWPLTSLKKRHIPLVMVINCTKLYDPGAYSSFLSRLQRFTTMWQQPSPLTSNLEKQ